MASSPPQGWPAAIPPGRCRALDRLGSHPDGSDQVGKAEAGTSVVEVVVLPQQDRSLSGRGFVKEGPRSPSVIGGVLPRAHDHRPRRLRTVDGHVIRAAARAHECQSDQPSRIPAPLIDRSLPRSSPSRPLDTRSLHVSRANPALPHESCHGSTFGPGACTAAPHDRK